MIRRGIALTVLALSALMVQSAAASLLPSAWVPDLALLLVVAVAIRQPTAPGLLLAFSVGYGADLLSGAPLGHHALLRMLAFVATAGIGTQFHLGRPLTLSLFVLGLSIVDAAGTAALSQLFGGRFPIDASVLWNLGVRATVNAGFAPLVAGLLRRVLDLLTEEEARRRSVHLHSHLVRR